VPDIGAVVALAVAALLLAVLADDEHAAIAAVSTAAAPSDMSFLMISPALV
jgi:hypothetical protein